jgi:predicted nucleic acid-binding protein
MLLDSNIFIYAIQTAHESLLLWCAKQDIRASNITRLEVLGYPHLSEKDKTDFHRLFEQAEIYPVSSAIIELAIQLRQQRKMSLGDAIIAATALESQQTLVTRNAQDFNWVEGLKVLDPFIEL